jgi:hypothetical protein
MRLTTFKVFASWIAVAVVVGCKSTKPDPVATAVSPTPPPVTGQLPVGQPYPGQPYAQQPYPAQPYPGINGQPLPYNAPPVGQYVPPPGTPQYASAQYGAPPANQYVLPPPAQVDAKPALPSVGAAPQLVGAPPPTSPQPSSAKGRSFWFTPRKGPSDTERGQMGKDGFWEPDFRGISD